MKMPKTIKRKLHYENENCTWFTVYGRKWSLGGIDRNTGYNVTLFTNCGYYGGYKLVTVEHGIEDYAILERV